MRFSHAAAQYLIDHAAIPLQVLDMPSADCFAHVKQADPESLLATQDGVAHYLVRMTCIAVVSLGVPLWNDRGRWTVRSTLCAEPFPVLAMRCSWRTRTTRTPDRGTRCRCSISLNAQYVLGEVAVVRHLGGGGGDESLCWDR